MEAKQQMRHINIWARYCICGEKMYINKVDWVNGIVTLRCPHEKGSEGKRVLIYSHGGEEGTHWIGRTAPKETHPYNCSNCRAVDSPIAEGECINCGKEAWEKR